MGSGASGPSVTESEPPACSILIATVLLPRGLKNQEGVDPAELEFDHADDELRKPEHQLAAFW